MHEINQLLIDKISLGFSKDQWTIYDIGESISRFKQAVKLFDGNYSKPEYGLYNHHAQFSLGNIVHPSTYLSILMEPQPKLVSASWMIISFNPSKLSVEGISRLKNIVSVITQIAPDGIWPFLMMAGKVSRLDVALDLKEYMYKDLILWKRQIKKVYFDEYSETITLGSTKSNSQLKAYDKTAELLKYNVFVKTSLYRLELRLRKTGKYLHEFENITNPFEKLIIADTAKAKSVCSSTQWQEFVKVVSLGGFSALNGFKMLAAPTRTLYQQRLEKGCRPEAMEGSYWETHWKLAFQKLNTALPSIEISDVTQEDGDLLFHFAIGNVPAFKWFKKPSPFFHQLPLHLNKKLKLIIEV